MPFVRRSCFVIDDDAGICKALSFTLRKLGFETSEIATPPALEAALKTQVTELVFLDLGLGQSGAMDILPILSQHGYEGPVQLMSGRSQGVLDEVAAAGGRIGLNMLHGRRQGARGQPRLRRAGAICLGPEHSPVGTNKRCGDENLPPQWGRAGSCLFPI
jgi:CheY-like chemotaxis protein